MMAELTHIFATYQEGGQVKVVYETKMYVGQIEL
jgi:hypothetical protein